MKEDISKMFVIVRNHRAAEEIKPKLPKGSVVVIDPCTLDHYISEAEREEMAEVTKAKAQMGVN